MSTLRPVPRTDEHLRVRAGRRARWLLEQYRSQGLRKLFGKARLATAQLLVPPTAVLTAPPESPREPVGTHGNREDRSHDVLAGMCAGVALRDLNLVDSLLAQLEHMEANEDDPDTLARFYRLDHLATRLRRNAENLRVLAGEDASSVADETTSLVDVLRAAISSIEQYTRIEIGSVAALAVVDFAANDVSRLVAELLDNATAQSPPSSVVTVSAHLTEQGNVLLRVEDTGIGLPDDRLDVLNARLSAVPMLDSESVEHMGVAVVRRLAAKHGIRAKLGKRAPHGTTATVLLPSDLMRDVTAAHRSSPATSSTELPSPEALPVRRHSAPGVSTADGTTGHVGASGHAIPPPRPSPESTQLTAEAASPTTTRNGLPRRVPHSLRRYSTLVQTAQDSPTDSEPDPSAGREQLITDLGAFSDGEQAAREAHSSQPPLENPAPAEGPEQ